MKRIFYYLVIPWTMQRYRMAICFAINTELWRNMMVVQVVVRVDLFHLMLPALLLGTSFYFFLGHRDASHEVEESFAIGMRWYLADLMPIIA